MSIEQNAGRGGKKIGRTRSPSTSLEDRVKQHPDFEKWEALAGEVEAGNPEDALAEEHRAEASEDRLHLDARLYWLRRGIGEDAQGFSAFGEHLKKPQELAKMYGVEVSVATEIVTDTQAEVETWLADQLKRTDFARMKLAAEKEIDRLERQLANAA